MKDARTSDSPREGAGGALPELKAGSAVPAPAGPAGVKLDPAEVDVWTAEAPVQASIPNPPAGFLSNEEEDRAARFYFNRHRSEYRFAHMVLRDVLSRYLAREPRQIEFRENQFGKPLLADCGNVDLEFNLSHSGRVVVVALALQRRIGVDVELIRPLPDLEGVAEQNFTPAERALLATGSPPDRLRAFFTCWTRKEAYIKAMGTGLSMPLNHFEASIPAGAAGRRVGPCWLADLAAPAGYAGAIAVENGFERLRHWRWSGPLSGGGTALG